MTKTTWLFGMKTDEVYSIVGNKTTEKLQLILQLILQLTTPAVTTGWVQAANGTWTYNKADGTKATGWIQDGSWYFLKADGVMATGWVKDGWNLVLLKWIRSYGNWLVNDNGTWYYLNASGAMFANTTVDGYKLNASGAWVK